MNCFHSSVLDCFNQLKNSSQNSANLNQINPNKPTRFGLLVVHLPAVLFPCTSGAHCPGGTCWQHVPSRPMELVPLSVPDPQEPLSICAYSKRDLTFLPALKGVKTKRLVSEDQNEAQSLQYLIRELFTSKCAQRRSSKGLLLLLDKPRYLQTFPGGSRSCSSLISTWEAVSSPSASSSFGGLDSSDVARAGLLEAWYSQSWQEELVYPVHRG